MGQNEEKVTALRVPESLNKTTLPDNAVIRVPAETKTIQVLGKGTQVNVPRT